MKLAVILASLVLAGSALARPEINLPSFNVASRDWRNPVQTLSAKMIFDTPDQPAARRDWVPADVVVNVTITLEGECPLRVGEKETFTLEGRLQNLGSSSRILVRLVPDGVSYAYQDLQGPIQFQRTIDVWGSTGTYDVSFVLSARGRIPIVPPNTLSEIVLHGPPQGQALSMTWKDAGNTEQLPSRYLFEIWEKRWWWKDILIARGESPLDTSPVVTVNVGPGSPELTQPNRVFVGDRNYLLRVALARKGTDYRPVPSPWFDAVFRYREVPGGFAERIVTPLGSILGITPDRSLDQVGLFELLHAPAR